MALDTEVLATWLRGVQAKKLYDEAAARSTSHPVVMFAFGMFKLMQGLYPRDKVWTEAHVSVRLASCVVNTQRMTTGVCAWLRTYAGDDEHRSHHGS